MAVIYPKQPVHCVKLNCLFFPDSTEAWWLCRLYLFVYFNKDILESFRHSEQELLSKDKPQTATTLKQMKGKINRYITI